MMNSLKVLYLGDCNNPHTVRWVNALRQKGHDVHLFSFTKPIHHERLPVEPGRFSTLGMEAAFPRMSRSVFIKWRYALAVPKLRQLCRAFQPDVINAHYVASYGLVAALSRVRPLVISVWGYDIYDWPQRSIGHRAAVRWALNSAVLVLSTSEAMAMVTSSYTSSPILVTPFGVDTVRFSTDPHRRLSTDPVRPFIIGTVKALETKYGIEFLLRAAAIIRHIHGRSSFELRIFGEGSLRVRLEQLGRELGVGQHVHFLGSIPNTNVPDAFRDMDIAVFPSIHDSESFGVAAIEAQACGVPVVASRVGGLPETVLDGITGILVPPCDPEKLAQAILKLWDSDSQRLEMGRSARQNVLDRFSLDRSVTIMETAYERAIQRSRS